MKRRSPSRAFTLIELLLVLVILAVLAAVVIPSLVGRAEEAKRGATIASIASLKQALHNYEIDNGKFPETNEGLDALVVMPNSTDAEHWKHKYIEKVPSDGWGHPFEYHGPNDVAQGMDFNIISTGKDGKDQIDVNTEK